MAPAIQTATLNTSYPLYACDFDPQDANRLVVGGGGGATKSGVPNKISVLDASHLESLHVVSELDLSRDEDSVTSLAVGPRRRNSIVLLTGINSSPAEVEKGKNEHFRVFAVDPSTKAKTTPKITELSRTGLFSYTELDAYQRVLRISPAFPDKAQIGAVATGLAKKAEIAVFDVPSAGGAAPKPRGKLELPKEAVDLDIIQTGDSEYQLVYCDSYEIYRITIGKKSIDGPRCVFTVPHDEVPRPSFRALRYLTPTFVLATANIPQGGGVVLQGFRLPKAEDGIDAKARLAISKRLPKTVARATGMAVRNLSPPSAPTTKYGDAQLVIAVAGSDSSISLYKLDHEAVGNVELIANLNPITTLPSVHPGPISGLVFSHFHPPKTPTMRVLHLKLASIGSIGNSCVVHALPLQRLPDKTSAAARRAGPPRQPRYVLALKSHGPSPRGLFTALALVTLLLAILGQALIEVQGLGPSIIGARHVVPNSWLANYATSNGAAADKHFLADFLVGTKLANDDKVVVLDVDDDAQEVRVDTHDEQLHGPAVEWNELPAEQQDAWKERLKRAGHWGEQMGEAVFKGVLFGEIAGVVGNAVRQGL
jgi:hypothetical protein